MKRLCIKLVVMMGAAVSFGACAMETNNKENNYGYEFGTYNGEQITAHTLLDLTPKIPGDVKSVVKAWLNDERNKALVEHVTTMPETLDPVALLLRLKGDRNMSALPGIENWSVTKAGGCNWVVPIYDENKEVTHVVKMAGMANKLRTIMASKVYDPYAHGRNPINFDYSGIDPQIPTYQHMSSLAYALRIKQLGLQKIAVPDMWAFHISGRPQECDDKNYFIVQEYVPGVQPFMTLSADEQREYVQNLSDEAIVEHFKAVRFASLFEPKLCVDPKDKERASFAVDLEQANNTSPQNFFYQTDPATFTYQDEGMKNNKYWNHAEYDGLAKFEKYYMKHATKHQWNIWNDLKIRYQF